MNKLVGRNVLQLLPRNGLNQINRCYCYKPIKRAPKQGLSNENKYLKNKFNEISLTKQIQARIAMAGPLTIADYMREILTNPNEGYYMTKDVFGPQGDFITSPEIGQIFGEILSIWCAIEWEKIGNPKPLQIIELGPGRGTLSRDLLKVFSQLKLSKEVSLHLVEISPFLSKLQSQKLCYQSTEIESDDENRFYRVGETISGIQVYWYKRVQDIPTGFSIVLAHEFFDALPIHKFQKDDNNKWREVLIDVDSTKTDSFRYVLSKYETPISKLFMQSLSPNETRNHIEMSLETNIIIEYLAKRFTEFGGFGLIVDYGHSGTKTDTFRSFRNHKLHDPLIEPGTADLTADVDFESIRNQCEANDQLITFGPVAQGDFLKNMNAEVRLEVLLRNANEEQKEHLKSGYNMLVNSDEMGERFKFFSFFPSILKEHLAKFPVNGFNSK